jgi:hypothetical protein
MVGFCGRDDHAVTEGTALGPTADSNRVLSIGVLVVAIDSAPRAVDSLLEDNRITAKRWADFASDDGLPRLTNPRFAQPSSDQRG